MSLAAIMVFILLPKMKHLLPTDRGKSFAQQGEKSKGKPQSAGVIFITIFSFVALLTIPPSLEIYSIIACIFFAMLTGHFDDKAEKPWGQLAKGLLDLAIAIAAVIAISSMQDMQMWLPFTRWEPIVPFWLYLSIAAPILWLMINATNCSDGVDGLAGVLSIIPILFLGIFLYIVIGHEKFADYLLIPHDHLGASWAILMMTMAGALSGYLWFNAEPSILLMGDAGSRAIGLTLGLAVLATGNFFFAIIIAPVILINGGAGLVKIIAIRALKTLGICTENKDGAKIYVRLIHRYRFPLHDHCRKEKKWSNAQVLMRFTLVQSWLLVTLFALLIKLR